jgi:hypothetical protein
MCRRSTPLLLAAALLAACGGGALGQTVTKEASAPKDPWLNAPLAIGARIRPELHATTVGGGAPSLVLESVRSDVVAVENGELVGRAKGMSAVIFATADGHVFDFLHVWVEKPNRLALDRLTSEGERLGELDDALELVVGDSVILVPRPYQGAQPLAGRAETTWTIEPAVAVALRDGTATRRRVLALRAGEGELTVQAFGLTAKTKLVVHDKPSGAPAAEPKAPEVAK